MIRRDDRSSSLLSPLSQQVTIGSSLQWAGIKFFRDRSGLGGELDPIPWSFHVIPHVPSWFFAKQQIL